MTPGTRVRHRETGKTGTVEWVTAVGGAAVRWDDPLTSGMRCVMQYDLEPIWPDNPTETGHD